MKFKKDAKRIKRWAKNLITWRKAINLLLQSTKLIALEVWIKKMVTMENQHVRCSSREIDRDKVR